MNKAIINILFLLATTFFAHSVSAQAVKYKCMIQMNAYEGEKAYVIISLIDPKGQHEKTLAVLGPDKQWYNTMTEWYKFQTKTKEKVHAVTGASIGGGDRAVRNIEIDRSKIDKGYKLRFESAVEDQKYIVSDVEVPMTTSAITERTTGKRYIRFVKLNQAQ